jgi:beta-lactamase regulating signal transducer with metallopeptidase domain
MTLLTEWISLVTLRQLALSLLHFLWQGVALAALACVAMALCRSASTRYAVAVAALVAMLLSPVATYFVLRPQQTDILQAASAVETRPVMIRTAGVFDKSTTHPCPQPDTAPFSLLLLVEAWFAGVVFLSLRSVGGIFVIERLRRRESTGVADDILELCLEVQDRMGICRMVRYCQSLQLDAPVAAGWMRPVVLLPISAITGLTSTQLEAVIAHELSHIRRYDAFVNLFQVAVETLLFYHPAVWWLNKCIRVEREHCCDDVAVALCGSPVVYARALARLAEMKPAPQFAMALNGSPLVERIARLLGANRNSKTFRTANLSAGVFCLSLALLAGSAFVGSVHKVHAQSAAPAPAAPQSALAPALPPRVPADAIVVRPSDPALAPSAPANPEARPVPAAVRTAAPAPGIAPVVAPAPAPVPQADPQRPKQSYIDSLKDAGLSNLTVDELIGLKVQGVTAEYVRAMKGLGIKSEPDELIGLKVQGVTPEYVEHMRAATGQNLDADALIGMKIQGVTPEYIRQIHDLGLKTDADDLVGMKIQGVTPEYVKEMRDLGLKVDSDNLIGMKIQGVMPAYVKGINDLGLHPTTDELIGMKIQGVTPAYIKELQAAGFKVDPDEAVGAKIQGITPELIASARSHGFKDLTLDKLIALKNSGVLDAEK